MAFDLNQLADKFKDLDLEALKDKLPADLDLNNLDLDALKDKLPADFDFDALKDKLPADLDVNSITDKLGDLFGGKK